MNDKGWFARVRLNDGSMTEVIVARYVSRYWAEQWLKVNEADKAARDKGLTFHIDYDHWGMRDGGGMSGL